MSKISNMTAADPLNSTETLEVVQGGVNKRTTVAAFFTWFTSAARTFVEITIGILKISGQAASSGVKNPTNIDSAGLVTKTDFVEVDTTNKTITHTGKDTLTSVVHHWRNGAMQALVTFYNDFTVRFWGTVAFIFVPTDITAGNAGIETRDIDGIQWREKDGSSNDFRTLEKIAMTDTNTNLRGKRINRFKKPIILDTGVGSPQVDDQIPGVSTTTVAAANNVILSLAIPTDHAMVLHLKNVIAYATNGNVVSMKNLQLVFRNVAGVVTAGTTAVTNDPIAGVTSVELRLTNDTGTGRQYYVFGNYAYSIIPLPL
jgi:hypothetical protein